MMTVPEVVARCQIACEAEATARGLDSELGRVIYYACIADDLEDWTQEQSRTWHRRTLEKYGISNQTFHDLRDAVRKTMNSYIPLLEEAGDR